MKTPLFFISIFIGISSLHAANEKNDTPTAENAAQSSWLYSKKDLPTTAAIVLVGSALGGLAGLLTRKILDGKKKTVVLTMPPAPEKLIVPAPLAESTQKRLNAVYKAIDTIDHEISVNPNPERDTFQKKIDGLTKLITTKNLQENINLVYLERAKKLLERLKLLATT